MKQTRRPGVQQAASGRDVQQNGGSQTVRGRQTERERRERGGCQRGGKTERDAGRAHRYTWNTNNTQTGQTADQTETDRGADTHMETDGSGDMQAGRVEEMQSGWRAGRPTGIRGGPAASPHLEDTLAVKRVKLIPRCV